MPLNKAKGRMFKSVGWTWNVIAGCIHDCQYCYAASLRERYNKSFEPELREHYFKDKMPEDGSWVFVGSMGDVFCSGVPSEWISKLLSFIDGYEGNNKFLLQTKYPLRFAHFQNELNIIKNKVVLGTTIETNRKTPWSKAQSTLDRMTYLYFMKHGYGFDTFLSLEPISEFDHGTLTSWIKQINPVAVEVGLENYTKFTKPPLERAILDLMTWMNHNNVEYVLKENLKHLKGKEDR